jgi:hypothetical protein
MSLNDATPEQWDAAWKAAQKAPEKVTLANPKQAYGDKKAPLHLVPGSAMVHIAMGLKEGSRKYGAFNWRDTNVEAQTYVGATLRHLMAYVDGEDIDPESGNHHLSHAMASLAILVDAMESDKLIDNRPVSGPTAAVLARTKED